MNARKRLAAYAGSWLPKSKEARRAWSGAAALSLALVLLAMQVRLDGKHHAEWEQFLGRFHPLAVHLPIGLLVLVPVLEVAGARRPALRDAAGFVLGLAFGCCLLALTLGFLLAHGGGSAGRDVTLHMWGGTLLTIGTMVCMLVRPWWLQVSTTRTYPLLLACTLLLLLWAAHMGGSLTHGSNYLTEHMPASLRRIVLRGGQSSDSFYARHINPAFEAKCVACHGAGQVKAGLRLDSYEQLMKGGQDGPVVVAGKPESSILLQRVTLPADHKGFMPAEGRPPLTSQEIQFIRAWIEQGTSPNAKTLAGIAVRDDERELPPQPVGDYSALMPEIQQMDQSQGAKLKLISSKPEDGLILYTADIAPNFGDAELTQFRKFAPYIVDAELGRTAVTDASLDILAKFTHLRALHLEETKVNGNGLAKLASLNQLNYLNLSGTQVTAAAVAPLKSMKNLRHLYLYNTPAQPAQSAVATNSSTRSNR